VPTISKRLPRAEAVSLAIRAIAPLPVPMSRIRAPEGNAEKNSTQMSRTSSV